MTVGLMLKETIRSLMDYGCLKFDILVSEIHIYLESIKENLWQRSNQPQNKNIATRRPIIGLKMTVTHKSNKSIYFWDQKYGMKFAPPTVLNMVKTLHIQLILKRIWTFGSPTPQKKLINYIIYDIDQVCTICSELVYMLHSLLVIPLFSGIFPNSHVQTRR